MVNTIPLFSILTSLGKTVMDFIGIKVIPYVLLCPGAGPNSPSLFCPSSQPFGGFPLHLVPTGHSDFQLSQESLMSVQTSANLDETALFNKALIAQRFIIGNNATAT